MTLSFCLFFGLKGGTIKFPKHTLPPQTPIRTALAHSTRTKSTDPVYGSESLSATGDRCGAERWIALARQRASSVKPSMREMYSPASASVSASLPSTTTLYVCTHLAVLARAACTRAHKAR